MRPLTEPLVINPNPSIPLVVQVPHSSAFIPSHVRNQFHLSDEELAEENRKLVDWFADELYSPVVKAGGCSLRYGVSRFVCDPERFEDDAKECMVQRGMGVVYTHGTERQRIRREITPLERESLLNEFYRPYHQELTERVRQVVETFGHCVLIDGHTYQEKPLAYELDGYAPRADVVFGDDPLHTPSWVRDEVERLTKAAGYSFGVNRPFAGTVVPLPLYGDTRVTSCMLEINRANYMDEHSTTRHAGLEKMQALISAIVTRIAERP